MKTPKITISHLVVDSQKKLKRMRLFNYLLHLICKLLPVENLKVTYFGSTYKGLIFKKKYEFDRIMVGEFEIDKNGKIIPILK